jgi:hypothetical protein
MESIRIEPRLYPDRGRRYCQPCGSTSASVARMNCSDLGCSSSTRKAETHRRRGAGLWTVLFFLERLMTMHISPGLPALLHKGKDGEDHLDDSGFRHGNGKYPEPSSSPRTLFICATNHPGESIASGSCAAVTHLYEGIGGSVQSPFPLPISGDRTICDWARCGW